MKAKELNHWKSMFQTAPLLTTLGLVCFVPSLVFTGALAGILGSAAVEGLVIPLLHLFGEVLRAVAEVCWAPARRYGAAVFILAPVAGAFPGVWLLIRADRKVSAKGGVA